MHATKALETLFKYAKAEVTNPTNTNAFFESPLIWQAEVLMAVKTLAHVLKIDLSETDMDIDDFTKEVDRAYQHIARTYQKSKVAQEDLAQVREYLNLKPSAP